MVITLASIASFYLMLRVLGSTKFENQFGSCEGIVSGINLPKIHDGVPRINEPCHSRRHCDGDGSIWCCATVGTCVPVDGERGVFVGSNKAYYEGGCSPDSLNSSHQEFDPACSQIGECHVGYMYTTKKAVPLVGTMTELPRATLDRLMAGSDWCSVSQTCQNTPCSQFPDLSSCTGVQSGFNLAKIHDGHAPLNEPCHSRRHCDGSIWCCVTVGTCVTLDGQRAFVGSNKAYYEGGCSPDSLNSSHEDHDPDCTQVGECHHPFILETRNSKSRPFMMTPTPGYILDRLMVGSNWNPTTQTCDTTEVSYSLPRHAALGFTTIMVSFWT